MTSAKPTVTSVTEGLAKTIREVRGLQEEVAGLRRDLKGFTDANPVDRTRRVLPPEAGGRGLEAKAETDEPPSEISKVRFEYANDENLEIPTRTLLAIAKELDGALRDIRSAKQDIKAIARDPDLTEEFRNWQQSQS